MTTYRDFPDGTDADTLMGALRSLGGERSWVYYNRGTTCWRVECEDAVDPNEDERLDALLDAYGITWRVGDADSNPAPPEPTPEPEPTPAPTPDQPADPDATA